MGARLAHSPNNKIVDLVYTRCLSNEDELTWNHLNNATKHAIPEWDSKHSSGHPHMSEDHYDICDGAKGATAAHKKTCKDITLFADMNHKKKSIKAAQGGGAAVANLYAHAWYAKTTGDLHQKIANINANERARQFLFVNNNTEPRNLFPLAAGLGKFNQSNAVESVNQHNKQARMVPFAYSLLALGQIISERQRKRYEEAKKWVQPGGGMPPKHQFPEKFHSEMMKYATGRLAHKVTYVDEGSIAVVVDSCSKAQFEVNLDELAQAKNPGSCCTCEVGAAESVPCEHMHMVAAERGVPVSTLLDQRLTSFGWFEVFRREENRPIPYPTAQQWTKHADLQDLDLALPPAYKRPAGAPRKKRFADSHELMIDQMRNGGGQKKKRKARTCKLCGQSPWHKEDACPLRPGQIDDAIHAIQIAQERAAAAAPAPAPPAPVLGPGNEAMAMYFNNGK